MQLQDEVLSRLDALALKLGVAGEHLWEVMVQRAYLEWIDVVSLVFLLIAVFVLRYLVAKSSDEYFPVEATCYNEWKRAEWRVFIWVLAGVAAIGLSISVAVQSTQAIQASLSPEYWALTHIFNLAQ